MTPKFLGLRWTHPAFHLLIGALLLLVNGDADFLDVRTRLDRDRSGKGGDPKEKYFHESTFHPHYDGRFAKQVLATAADIGIEVWLIHGSLLGWWWNQKILPWDSDLDLQVSEQTIAFLADYYNMTEYHFRLPANKKGRTYLFEVNPGYNVRKTEDKLNVIDARWIDTDTGLFIDISTVRADRIARAHGVKGALMCKDKHRYLVRFLPMSCNKLTESRRQTCSLCATATLRVSTSKYHLNIFPCLRRSMERSRCI